MGRPANQTGPNLTTAAGVTQAQQDAIDRAIQASLAANRPTVEQTPYGSQTYFTDPVTGELKKISELSPEQQQILAGRQGLDIGLQQTAQGLLPSIQQQLQQPFSYEGIPGLPTTGDLSADRQRMEQKLYDTFLDRMQPQFDREQERLEQQLANQGVPRGSEKYTKALDDMRQRQNDALMQASARATELGGQELRRSFDIGLEGRKQGIAEYTDQRYAPLTELGSLRGQTYGVQQPSFTPQFTQATEPVDVAGIAGQFLDAQTREKLQRLVGRQGMQQLEAQLANALNLQGLRNEGALAQTGAQTAGQMAINQQIAQLNQQAYQQATQQAAALGQQQGFGPPAAGGSK